MLFKATVTVSLKPAVLDAQGKALEGALQQLGFAGVSGVRVNKSIQLSIEAASTEAATSELTSMCNKLLANTVIENFHISLTS